MSWHRWEAWMRPGADRRTGDSRGPGEAFSDRFRPWHRSRTVLGGPQIASCELGRAGAGPIGAMLASWEAREPGSCVPERAGRRSEAQR